MQKDFITATPDSGGSGSTTVTAAASANQTESARSVNLSVAGGGMTRTVAASQAARVVTWNYYFSVTPTSLSFVAGGESKSVTVISYRKKVINGVETSTQENIAWMAKISGTGFSKNPNGTTITAGVNSGDSRSGSVSYTQGTSRKTASVSLSQAEDSTSYTITFIGGSKGTSYYLFNTGSTPVGSPLQYRPEVNGPNGNISPRIWFKREGLQTCDVGNARKTIFVPAGTRVTIRSITGIAQNWNNSRITFFTLEENNQRVILP